MATNHDVWDAVAQTEGTPGNSFEFLVAAKAAGSSQFNASADISNVNPAFTAKNRQRQTYAAKGVDLALKYGDTLALTFDVEVVRDENGAYQPFLQDLIDASKAVGIANLRELQVYDALGADYAIEAKFSISVSRNGTGWDEAAWFTVTATQYGKVEWIENPVLVGNIPTGLSVSPSSAAGGATVYVQGQNLEGTTGVTGVKFGSTNATSYEVVSDTLIKAVVPGTGAASLPVTVTNPTGTSAPVAFQRTA